MKDSMERYIIFKHFNFSIFRVMFMQYYRCTCDITFIKCDISLPTLILECLLVI